MKIDLTKYNEQFIAKLDQQLAVYTTIGGKNESPIWFQLRDRCATILLFRSSQNNYMYFDVQIDKEDSAIQFMSWDSIYDHFKALKYQHIKDNWPSVYNEIK